MRTWQLKQLLWNDCPTASIQFCPTFIGFKHESHFVVNNAFQSKWKSWTVIWHTSLQVTLFTIWIAIFQVKRQISEWFMAFGTTETVLWCCMLSYHIKHGKIYFTGCHCLPKAFRQESTSGSEHLKQDGAIKHS